MSRSDGGRDHSGGNSGGKIAQTRRKLLAMTGAGVSIGIAGCSFFQDETGNGNGNGNGGAIDLDDIVEGGTLRIGLSENPSSFDPPFSNDNVSSQAQSLIYESLTRNDSEGNIYPWLAKSFELVELQDLAEGEDDDYDPREAYEPYMVEAPVSEDDDGNRFIDTEEQIVVRSPNNNIQEEDTAMVLTVNEAGDPVADGVFGMQFQYELHEGVEFHNGEEMTSENVVRSYERYENSFLEAQTFDAFLHAEAVDEYTVNVYAQVINAAAARELPVTILPLDHIDLEGGSLDPRQGTDPVGTGPYVFEEIEDEQFFRLSKNENYWVEQIGLENFEWWDGPENFPESPVYDEVDVSIIPDDSTRSAAIQNDEIDITTGVSSDTLDDFEASEGYGVDSVQSTGYDYMQYPVQIEPWDDERLRQGVNHLIPRSAIANEIFQGWRTPAWTPVPGPARGAGTTDYEALESDLKPLNELDRERADELIGEAVDDLGLDTPIEIRIETNQNDDRVKTVELIAESMEQSEYFEVTVETYEFPTFLGRILDTGYQDRGHIYYVGLGGGFNPDSYCSAVNHSRNIGQCCNANGVAFDDLDTLIDDALEGPEVAGDPELRAEKYDEIWEIIVERAPTSYINISNVASIFTADLKGWTSFPISSLNYAYGVYAPHAQQISYMDRQE